MIGTPRVMLYPDPTTTAGAVDITCLLDAVDIRHGRPSSSGQPEASTITMTDEHPTEGPIVRQLVDRLLSGESLSALARWLNEEGIPTPSTEYRLAKGKTPAKWTGPNLRGMLKSPHLAGRRIHHGRDVGPAAWPALIPVEKHAEDRWAGTTDAIARLRDGARWLLDYKTGESGVYPEHALQVCAYRFATHMQLVTNGEPTDWPMVEVDRCGLVWVQPDFYELRPVVADEDRYRVFRSMAGITEQVAATITNRMSSVR